MAKSPAQHITFTSEDGFIIHGNLLRAGKKAVLLMHQFQLDKSSYSSFAQKLSDAGFTALAIDLRGHGESVLQNGKRRDFRTFSDKDFQDMLLDAKAAKELLQKEGFELYAAVGSSIGANTALMQASQDREIQKIVLLSPGMDYFGIEITGAAKAVRAKTLIVASEEDSYSYTTSEALEGMIPNSELRALHNAGHGTGMFDGTNLQDELVKWLLG
ncbi:MAG TPA: alpha/beta fold hydrolase [archaeon]|nr:alpha/beta fold hydrolase [archaeon]